MQILNDCRNSRSKVFRRTAILKTLSKSKGELLRWRVFNMKVIHSRCFLVFLRSLAVQLFEEHLHCCKSSITCNLWKNSQKFHSVLYRGLKNSQLKHLTKTKETLSVFKSNFAMMHGLLLETFQRQSDVFWKSEDI